MPLDPTQFLGLPSPGPDQADALVLPVPVEKTVSYGQGTRGGPQAIIDASLQIETFDEETLVEFAAEAISYGTRSVPTTGPRPHTLPPLPADGDIEQCLSSIAEQVRQWRGRFLLALGGEHSITYGVVSGLLLPAASGGNGSADLTGLTIVQIDAHADLINELDGRHWSHGTVMRRLWERGCRLVQIGIRSLSGEEYQFASAGPRITTYYAHRLESQWVEVLQTLRDLEGKVYLTIDVDGLDPSIIPSTGTPQPGGLSWRQMMDVLRVLGTESNGQLIGADIVELVPSPTPPGSDPAAARVAMKLLAWWWKGRIQKGRDAR
jgi:agmatinase